MKAPPETASTLRHRAAFRTRRHAVWSKRTWIGLIAHLWLSASVLAQQVTEVGPIGLTVAHLDRPLAFFTNALPFELEAVTHQSGDGWDQLYALDRVDARQATLKLGEERITLTEHRTRPGRPIPPDSRSLDHWFQHIAIVVSDTEASLRFYRDVLGFRVAGGAENHGVEQEHLNQVFGARLRITALRAPRGPGIEFLEFRDSDGHALQLVEPAPDSRP